MPAKRKANSEVSGRPDEPPRKKPRLVQSTLGRGLSVVKPDDTPGTQVNPDTVTIKLTFSIRKGGLVKKRRLLKSIEKKTGTTIQATSTKYTVCGTDNDCKQALCMILRIHHYPHELSAELQLSENFQFSTRSMYDRVLGRANQGQITIQNLTGAQIRKKPCAPIKGSVCRRLVCGVRGSADQVKMAKVLMEMLGSGSGVDTSMSQVVNAVLCYLMKVLRRKGVDCKCQPSIEGTPILDEVGAVVAVMEQSSQDACAESPMTVTERAGQQSTINQFYKAVTPIASESNKEAQEDQASSTAELFAKHFPDESFAHLFCVLLNDDHSARFKTAVHLLQQLELLDASDVAKLRSSLSGSSVPPFIVSFPNGPQDAMMFSSLVAFLLSTHNRLPGQWVFEATKEGIPRCCYRNCIEFVIDGYPAAIVLINSGDFFEVYISINPDYHECFCPTLCPLVRKALLDGIKQIAPASLARRIAFFCTCGVPDSHHLAYPSAVADSGLWICSEDRQRCTELSTKHQLWLTDAGTHIDTQAYLTMQDFKHVRTALWPVRMKWQDIGVELDLSIEELDNIKDQHRNDPKCCLDEMVKMWLKRRDPVPIMETLIQVLKGPILGEESLAMSLCTSNS